MSTMHDCAKCGRKTYNHHVTVTGNTSPGSYWGWCRTCRRTYRRDRKHNR